MQLKEVLKELKQIKKTKSAGIDQIPPTLLKDGAEEIAYVLTHLINRSLAIGTFPTEEKIGKISPIYKSEDHNKFDNYRPISILNIT